MVRRLAILLIPFLLAGCGGVHGTVNSKKKMKSEWTIQLTPLTGNKRNMTAELMVNGNKWRIHKVETGRLNPMFEATIYVQESDLIYDGKTLWETNIKTYPKGKPDEASEENVVYKMEPDKDQLAGIEFWKIPSALPLAEDGSETISSVPCKKYISRQRSALGTDVTFRYWVDAGRGVVMKSSVGTGSDSGGGKDAVLGSVFECTKVDLAPALDSKDFEFSSDSAEEMPERPFRAL